LKREKFSSSSNVNVKTIGRFQRLLEIKFNNITIYQDKNVFEMLYVSQGKGDFIETFF
jgi:hypothetical protein